MKSKNKKVVVVSAIVAAVVGLVLLKRNRKSK